MEKENINEALARAIAGNMAGLDEQESVAELAKIIDRLGVENYLRKAKVDINPATIQLFADLVARTQKLEEKRQRLGIPTQKETMQAYRENMQDSSGKWLESYEDVITASYLHRLTGGLNNGLNEADQERRLFDDTEHELLKVLYHFMYASMCDAWLSEKGSLADFEASVSPKQRAAITEWKKRHGKNASDLRSMITKVKVQGKYFTIGCNGDLDGVITIY